MAQRDPSVYLREINFAQGCKDNYKLLSTIIYYAVLHMKVQEESYDRLPENILRLIKYKQFIETCELFSQKLKLYNACPTLDITELIIKLNAEFQVVMLVSDKYSMALFSDNLLIINCRAMLNNIATTLQRTHKTFKQCFKSPIL